MNGVRFLGARFRAVMHYWLVEDGDRTRLLMRVQSDTKGALGRAAGWTFRIIDTIMARRQLLGIKERAERFGDRELDPDTPETGERGQFQLYQVIYASGVEAGAPGRCDAAPWRQAAVVDGVVEKE